MAIPLEVRHIIFKFASLRDDPPDHVLQHWFEKREVDTIIAASKVGDTTGTIFEAQFPNNRPHDVDDESVDGAEEEEAEDDENEEDDEDSDEGDHEDEEDSEEDSEDDDQEDDSEDDDQENDQDQVVNAAIANALNDAAVNAAMAAANVTPFGDNSDDNTATANVNTTAQDDDSADDDDGLTDDNTATNVPSTAGPPVEVVHPSLKWRHITKFMRISDYPPPLELLRVSQTIKNEALDWFYAVAKIRIDVTGSFKHTSMFEEALDQITNAAFSPFENIQNVHLKFVWDTEWLRGPGSKGNETFFQMMLHVRAQKVVECLKRSPQLKKVAIRWYDSLNDPESIVFKNEVLDQFDNLVADVEITDHFLTPGKKPHRRSTQGKKRLEFQHIADEGFALV